MMGGGVLSLCIVLASTAPAAAEDDPRALYRSAEDAERSGDPSRARDFYRQLEAIAPRSRLAGQAAQRRAWIEARSEGGYRPLGALLRAHEDPDRDDPARVAAFEAEAVTFPPGLVRREALAFIGEGWLAAGRADRALAAFDRWSREPGLPAAERRMAAVAKAKALVATHEIRRAVATLEEAGASDTAEAVGIHRAMKRIAAWWVAFALVAVYALVVLSVARRVWRRWRVCFRWKVVLIGAYVVVVPLALAWMYDAATLDTFAPVAFAQLACLAAAQLAGRGLDIAGARAPTRRSLAVLTALAVVAASYLVLPVESLVQLGL
jgi:hypothetical protein